MRIPDYLDGKPNNLQAAIIDTEHWLRWLRSQLNEPRLKVPEWNEQMARFRLAIKILEKFLPDEEPSCQDLPADKPVY